jgi:cytidylate kinase
VAEVQDAIEDRDRRDRSREHGALRAAEDSVSVDTTDLSPDQVVERIAELARARGIA